MHAIKTAFIIVSLFTVSCAASVRRQANPVGELEMRLYGKGYTVMQAVKASQRGETPQKVLALLNEGISQLGRAGLREVCGSSGNPCIIYMVIGRLTRAAVYSALSRKDEAVGDLIWLHRKGLLRFVALKLNFWEHKIFNNLHGHPRFEFLVRIYRK